MGATLSSGASIRTLAMCDLTSWTAERKSGLYNDLCHLHRHDGGERCRRVEVRRFMRSNMARPGSEAARLIRLTLPGPQICPTARATDTLTNALTRTSSSAPLGKSAATTPYSGPVRRARLGCVVTRIPSPRPTRRILTSPSWFLKDCLLLGRATGSIAAMTTKAMYEELMLKAAPRNTRELFVGMGDDPLPIPWRAISGNSIGRIRPYITFTARS